MSSTVSSVGVEVPTTVGQADPFLNHLLDLRQDLQVQQLGDETASWWQELRDRAAAGVQARSLPTTRQEEWRFTDLAPLKQLRFRSPTDMNEPAIPAPARDIPELAPLRLVFVNGAYADSTITELPGMFMGSLSQLPAAYQTQLKAYLAQQPGAEELFTTLNTASFSDAAVVWVGKNQVVEQPIQLVFQTTAGAYVAPRCLVVAEPGSAVTLVEDYSTAGDAAFTNAVTEIYAAANAQVNHTRIQREHDSAFHIGKTAIAQERDSRYTCHAISVGAKLSRHHLEVYQKGEQTETVLNGLTVVTGDQLADTHSLIAYSRPHSSSRQLHKCIVDDRAHGVFNGKVFVPKAAQLTDAGQLNRNLLLSPKARVDTKPQLEIVADNVKCTHGATVSQLDAEEIFYLQSRGLDRASASKLLVEAFATETLEQIPVESVQRFLSQLVLQRVR